MYISQFLKKRQLYSNFFVDDPVEFYSSADYLINPMNLGSGSNIKVAEAISANLPILSTEFEGEDLAEENKDYILFDRDNLKEAPMKAIEADSEKAYKMATDFRSVVINTIDGKLICQSKLVPLIENSKGE